MTIRALIFVASLLCFLASAHAQPVTVAVAANMKDAFAEIVTAFKATGKPELRVVYGSSGNLTTQIMNGAPFSLFIAADEYFPLELSKKGKTIDEGSVYAIGKLALIAKTSSSTILVDNKVDIARALMKANKVAIAKPELAPYGRAAIEYLKAEGLWEIVRNKLVYGDNVGAITTYVLTGAADLGFTALSLAKSPEVSKETNYLLLNNKLYEPIKQRMILIKGAPPEALELYRFMQSAQARVILQKYGYTTP